MPKKKMVFVAKVGIDPTAFPLLGERSIQLSYSATSMRGAMFEDDLYPTELLGDVDARRHV